MYYVHISPPAREIKVAGYLPNFPYTDITVRQLLSHTSGIADAMPYYTNLIRGGAPEKPVTGADVVTVLASQQRPRLAPAGVRYAYSNTGYMVLAALVERQTGRPFGAYLQQAFFGPLGLQDTRLRTPASETAIRNRAFGFADAPVGKRRLSDQFPGLYMLGAGGIYSTAPDLLKWENALNAGRVVPEKLLAIATTPARLIDGTSVPYGFGLSLKPDVAGNDRVSHGGHWRAFKSDLSYYPAMNVTVIQLTNNNQDDSVDTNAAALATMAKGGTPPAPRGPIGWALAERAGRDDARQWFIAQLARQPREYDIEETDLNGLGYAYLKEKNPARAIRVFELETLAFPKSPK
ncbi:MAG: class A beta-lactamase-related serine hydrolase, partial [Oxalobacteraceae bacterium]